jgi:hypothetical protein
LVTAGLFAAMNSARIGGSRMVSSASPSAKWFTARAVAGPDGFVSIPNWKSIEAAASSNAPPPSRP